MRSNIIDITLQLLRETEKAVQVTDSNPGEAVWLPRSQIEIAPAETATLYVVTLPDWLAQEKGLI